MAALGDAGAQWRQGGAQADVAQRRLGGDRHLHVAQASLAGAGAGGAGVQCAAPDAENIELPAGVQAQLGAAAGVVPARRAALRRGRVAQRRQQAGGGHPAQGAGLAQRGLRAQHAGVGLQRLADQVGQQRVAKTRPPGDFQRAGRAGARASSVVAVDQAAGASGLAGVCGGGRAQPLRHSSQAASVTRARRPVGSGDGRAG